MIPRERIAAARTPDGGEMVLYRHDRDFLIEVNGHDLMHSRRHESELDLARLGCAHLVGRKSPCILIGGLGMGYTLRQALHMLGSQARVVVSELSGAVIQWNREFFGELNGEALKDERVELKKSNVVELISRSRDRFDAILLDVDNGPRAMADASNRSLYDREGILACGRALRAKGCLALWSAGPDMAFERRLMRCGFQVRRFKVRAHRGAKSRSCLIWVASISTGSNP